jgi:VIT1/CCC1 family predicted Fe2+/Mn2+ transporter
MTGEPLRGHGGEPHGQSLASRLNWLRAGVLGANDGIVSTAGIVVGVAGATTDRGTILTAGVAGMVAGALSMAAGEYVSVSSQRDTERSMIAKEVRELHEDPAAELEELAGLLEGKGLSPALAIEAADELTRRDALRAHLDVELGIDPNDLASPWNAAFASAVAFTVGALLPLVAILLPGNGRVPITFAAVVAALALTGFISAWIGQAEDLVRRAMLRNITGGALAMTITYAVGSAIGGVV